MHRCWSRPWPTTARTTWASPWTSCWCALAARSSAHSGPCFHRSRCAPVVRYGGHRGARRAPSSGLYRQRGVLPERVLIKIAATWEGIEAARQLEAQGIRTNLTLLFAFCQAVACGNAGVQLISRLSAVSTTRTEQAGASSDEQAMASTDRSWRAVGTPHLPVLQAARHQDRNHWAPASAIPARSWPCPAVTC